MHPRVREVGPDVFHVEVSHTNAVLVREGDELTLIDSGYPRDRHLVDAAVRQLGGEPADLSAVLLTHAHVDHIGSAERLRRDHGIPVHCHAAEAAHARGKVEERISERDLLRRLWRPGVAAFVANVVANGGLRPPHLTEVTTFADGEEVDVPGRPMAIHSPGHTSGHAAFHLPDRGVLVTGDALITVDVWDRSDRGPQVIRAPFNHDHERALGSLARFEDLAADAVVPGHGRPYRGTPAQAVAEARRHAAA